MRRATPLLLLPGACDCASFCDSGNGWQEVWADEFNQTHLDTTSWTIDLGGNDSNVRNSLGTADNVYLEDGALVLRSQRERKEGFDFTSGAVQSQDKRFFAGPARVCVSASLPGGGINGTAGDGQGDGIWPAHWLMPNTDACWPTNGEIDIMEMINGDGLLHGTYHWSNDTVCGHNQGAGNHTVLPPDWATGFHEYAVEYSDNHVAFVVDGYTYSNVTQDDGAVFFDVPWYVILNTAVGGPWPRPVGNETVLPTYHRIDYVRVSQLDKHGHQHEQQQQQQQPQPQQEQHRLHPH